MVKHPAHPIALSVPNARLVELLDRYAPMLNDQPALIDEGRRLTAQPHVQCDQELSVFLWLVLGHVATLKDRVDRLTLLSGVRCN